jgi:hypothetical protein
MHPHVIKETVERLRRDQAFQYEVARDSETMLAGLGLTRDERQALAALSRQPDAATALRSAAW